MSVLLFAGIGVFVAGLVAVVFGIPVKEFSFGNTLIMSGAVVACTGLIMMSLSLVVRELRVIARQLRGGSVTGYRGADLQLPAAPASDLDEDVEGDQADLPERVPAGPRSAAAESASAPPLSPPPWQAESSARERTAGRADAVAAGPPVLSPAADVPPPPKPRRNLLFSSSSRKERERAAVRASDPAGGTIPPAEPATAAAGPEMSPPPSFDEAWPQSERLRAEQRNRAFTAQPQTGVPPVLPDRDRGGSSGHRTADGPAVTVLKSGVVDGMAYSLYSDGSIEAQMPEGMMRFGSIDELRAHLDHRQ